MILRAGLFKLPKRGNSDAEYEDAFYPLSIAPEIHVPFECAIGDGASETSYSGLWASLVTQEFCKTKTPSAFLESIECIRKKWHEETTSKPLPWYAEQKLAKGAFCTLLGLTIENTDSPSVLKWTAHAVGDSCLFYKGTSGKFISFPVESSHELEARPMLLCSIPLENDDPTSLFKKTEGTLETGDRLYLVTDALAGWILKGEEQNSQRLESINQAIKTIGGFEGLIRSLWEENSIKNDDYTLLWLEVVE